MVGLRVFKVAEPPSDAWNIPAPPVVGGDYILGRVNWMTDRNVVVLWLNRRQNLSVLVNCDLSQDKCSVVKQRNEPNGWIDINEPFFDESGTKMIEIEPQPYGSRRYLHVAQFDFKTLATRDLTPINSTVTDILGYIPEQDAVYYILAPLNAPWQRQLWVSTAGVQRCVSCKEPSCHFVNAMFSPSASYGVVSCSASYNPPKTFFFRSQVRMEIFRNFRF